MLKLTNWSRGAAAGTMALLMMIGTPVSLPNSWISRAIGPDDSFPTAPLA